MNFYFSSWFTSSKSSLSLNTSFSRERGRMVDSLAFENSSLSLTNWTPILALSNMLGRKLPSSSPEEGTCDMLRRWFFFLYFSNFFKEFKSIKESESSSSGLFVLLPSRIAKFDVSGTLKPFEIMPSFDLGMSSSDIAFYPLLTSSWLLSRADCGANLDASKSIE